MVLVNIKLFYQDKDGRPLSVPEHYPQEIEIGGLDSAWDLSFAIAARAIALTMESVGIDLTRLDPELMIRWEIGKCTPIKVNGPAFH
jgi:hypothetical protein